jgi:hypothetical protein
MRQYTSAVDHHWPVVVNKMERVYEGKIPDYFFQSGRMAL